VAAITESEVVY